MDAYVEEIPIRVLHR